MSMDDLRRQALESELEDGSFDEYLADDEGPDRMFGMTAAERMFVSVGCFLVTCSVCSRRTRPMRHSWLRA